MSNGRTTIRAPEWWFGGSILRSQASAPASPLRDLWDLIAKMLHQERVVGQPSVTRETLEDRVQSWFAKDKARRIVLLLDESDRFLEADAKTAYENVDGLKGLMDKTDRRFKIVFAGLHDVQRTSKSVNSPLAHFVDPVCVGPLLDNGESREALALIVLPWQRWVSSSKVATFRLVFCPTPTTTPH